MASTSILSRFNRWALLRLAGILLSIAAIAMLASLIPTLQNNGTYYADGIAVLLACLPFAGAAWTILYNTIALCLLLARQAYHPGIDIALDFIGWGLNWAMGILLIIWIADFAYTDYECDLEYRTQADCATAKRVVGLQYAGSILVVILGTLHLAFFIRACVGTHYRRISAERAKFIELGGMNRG